MRYATVNKSETFKFCKNEQQFKLKWVNINRRAWKKLWCIETEETVGGFPDVLAVDYSNKLHLFEFKISDKSGRIKFQPTQPAFYRNNKDVPIHIIVLDKKEDVWVHFKAQYLFDSGLLSDTATISVSSVLEYIQSNNLEEDNLEV